MSISHLELEEKRETLKNLRVEHRKLDHEITESSGAASVDQFEIRRLKRRKLELKDAISKLESAIIPDLNA